MNIRIAIYTSDIMAIDGIQRNAAGKKISAVKKSLKKLKKDVITVHEYAKFHNIDFEPLLNAINSKSVSEYVKKAKETKDIGIENICSDIPIFKIANCSETL